jgi:transcriptional regulator of met regulon
MAMKHIDPLPQRQDLFDEASESLPRKQKQLVAFIGMQVPLHPHHGLE